MSRTARRLLVAGLTLSALMVAPTPAADARPASPATAATYTVRAGDTLIGIASKAKVRLADLLAVNALTTTSLIYPGMVLTLPTAGGSAGTANPSRPAAAPAQAAYTVKPGDSLIGIARRHGVTLKALLAANGLTRTSLIWPGMVLTLPAGAVAPSTPTTAAPASSPTTTVKPVPSASVVTHTVVRGEFLAGIAARYKVSLDALLTLNGLTATSLILPGKVLLIPAVSPAATPSTTMPATTAPTTPAPTTTPGPAASGKAATVVAFATAQVGKPYKFFTAGPDTYDCSGLTRAAYLQVGVSLPHQSAAQSVLGTAIDWTTQPIRPGDLVFLTRDGTETSPITHVGIAVDGTTWVHATRPGDVVRTGTIPRWRVVEVRRFVDG